MPSNSEMFERGALDAEHDELNTFYYQHYYYYRRGYDDARRRSRAPGRLPAPALLVLALALGFGLGAWWFFGRAPTPVATQPLSTPVALAATARPTAIPTPRPTQTPAPTALPALGIGAQARVVNLNGAPLRAREAPGLSAPVAARIPEGALVTLRDGPVEADGYQWWSVEAEAGAGWVAGRAPDGAAFLELAP